MSQSIFSPSDLCVKTCSASRVISSICLHTYAQRHNGPWHHSKNMDLGGSGLQLAVKEMGDVVCVLQALEKGEVHINARDTRRYSALMYACRDGILDVVELLVALGADVNAQNTVRFTSVDPFSAI
jgi:ABC-type metal ion transport system substrate-binding protein